MSQCLHFLAARQPHLTLSRPDYLQDTGSKADHLPSSHSKYLRMLLTVFADHRHPLCLCLKPPFWNPHRILSAWAHTHKHQYQASVNGSFLGMIAGGPEQQAGTEDEANTPKSPIPAHERARSVCHMHIKKHFKLSQLRRNTLI